METLGKRIFRYSLKVHCKHYLIQTNKIIFKEKKPLSKKSDRIVYKNDNGKWVNKKVSAKKATSIHDKQKNAEKAAKNNLKYQGGEN